MGVVKEGKQGKQGHIFRTLILLEASSCMKEYNLNNMLKAQLGKILD